MRSAFGDWRVPSERGSDVFVKPQQLRGDTKTMNAIRSLVAKLGLGWLAAGQLVLPSVAQAGADDEPRYALAWSRAQQAEACPDREQLVGALAARLGRDPFDADSQHNVSVELSRHESTWQATLRVCDAEGQVVGSQQITSQSADCDDLFRATVAALAVMLGSAVQPVPEAPEAVTDESQAQPLDEPEPEPAPPPSPMPGPMRRHNVDAQAVQQLPAGAPVADLRPGPRSWLGLELAGALGYFSGTTGVCSRDSAASDRFDCYTSSGEEFDGVAHPEVGNEVRGGLSPAPVRLLVTYHHLLSARLGAEVRAGAVIANRPQDSLPAHLELGIRYWQGDLSRSRLYFGASIGLAAFDSDILVTAVDCATEAAPDGDSSCLESPPSSAGQRLTLTAVRRLGIGFAGITVGTLWKLADQDGLLLQNSLYATFPSSGLVIQPSIGYARLW
jgi:hypothetical protein